MGVIADLETADMLLDKLTAKFVRDWRIKTKVNEDGAKVKRWLRRSRLVAREFANDKRDDVYSGSYSLRYKVLRIYRDSASEQRLGLSVSSNISWRTMDYL